MNNIFKNTLQLIVWAFLAFSVDGGWAFAADVDLAVAVKRLQAAYEKTNNVSADFVQETIPAGANEGIEARGKVFFARPSKMRWEYEEPEEQLIVTSGKDVFVFEKEAGQVMVIPRKRFLSSEISQAFFFGKAKLDKYFRIESPRAKWLDGKAHLRLEPLKENMQIKTMWIGLDPDSGLVRHVWMEDRLGTRTHIIFSNISINSRLSPRIFEFKCPKGVEIYRSQDISFKEE